MTNPWLEQKRIKLIGSPNFNPYDYGHLLWHWGYINNQERDYLKQYGKIRGLVLACQGRTTTWTHSHQLYPGRSRYFNETESQEIEKKWRCLVRELTLGKISFLDWLTQEPVDFNTTRDQIVTRYKTAITKWGCLIGK